MYGFTMSGVNKKSSRLVYQQDSTYNIKVMEAEAEVVCPKGWFIYDKRTKKDFREN